MCFQFIILYRTQFYISHFLFVKQLQCQSTVRKWLHNNECRSLQFSDELSFKTKQVWKRKNILHIFWKLWYRWKKALSVFSTSTWFRHQPNWYRILHNFCFPFYGISTNLFLGYMTCIQSLSQFSSTRLLWLNGQLSYTFVLPLTTSLRSIGHNV